MRTFRSTHLRLLAVATLVSLALGLNPDSHRVQSLAAKLRCSCGCGDILDDCSHPKCEARATLKHELADAIQQGQTDQQILEAMGARHGFNTMLWIVPIAVSLFGSAFVLWGQLRSKRQPIDKAQ